MKKNKIARRIFTRTLLSILIPTAMTQHAHSSGVRSDIDYQLYRDFAENRGRFTAGATNLNIINKSGVSVGNVLPDGIGMPDFSAALRNSAVATLIDPQYLVSVQHNGGYKTAEFGYAGNNPNQHVYSYQLTDRNEFSRADPYLFYDYHAPRLHKLVTETAPANVSRVNPYEVDNSKNPYRDSKRFPVFIRMGGGTQFLRNTDGTTTDMGGAYTYRIGGNAFKIIASGKGHLDFEDNDYYKPDYNTTALPAYAMQGDSGSPVYAYDTTENRWVLIGVLQANWSGPDGTTKTGTRYRVQTVRPTFNAQSIADDTTAPLNNTQPENTFNWIANGNTSNITSGSTTVANVDLYDDTQSTEANKLQHGKTLHINGENGTIQLGSSINQGAGALHFHSNYTVSAADNNFTHQGAGVSVDADKTVNWQVKNPTGDRLSKIGAGTLNVSGEGGNSGSISVGDGTVILNQRADVSGSKQAFSELGIVSGRPTVVLGTADQMDLNKIYFGYYGGRLDVNGQNAQFNYIQNVDDGAQIVNHTDQKATVTVQTTAPVLMTVDNIKWSNWGQRSEGMYEYTNGWASGRKDYFLLKPNGNPSAYYPTNGTSNGNWEYLGSDKAKAIETYLERENAKRTAARYHAFNGWIGETDSNRKNGALDFQYQGNIAGDLLMISGGTNVNGNITVSNGNLLLSGRHTPHAYDHQNKTEIFDENDWMTRDFAATQFVAKDKGALYFGRNVGNVKGDIVVQDNARATVGYVAGETPVCVRSDQSGAVSCEINNATAVSESALANLTRTEWAGNATLSDSAQLTLGKAHFSGSLKAENSTTLAMKKDALWDMSSDQTIGNLAGENGEIVLHPTNVAPDEFHTLTVNGNLSGSLKWGFNTDIAQNRGDQVIVNGTATGTHTLAVKNTDTEPTQPEKLVLMKLQNATQKASDVNIALENGYVDAGAWRYNLANNTQNDYYLHSPVKEQEFAEAAEAEKKRLAEEAEKLAAQKRVEEEAKRLAEREAARKLAEQQAAEAAQKLADELARKQAELAKAEAEKHAATEAAKRAQEEAEAAALAKVKAEAALLQQQQAKLVSAYSNTALSELSAQAYTLEHIGKRIEQRVHKTHRDQTSVWLETDWQKTKHESDNYRGYEHEEVLTQLGADKTIRTQNSDVLIGAALSHAQTDLDFDGDADGNIKTTIGSVYGKAQFDNGMFIAADAGIGRASSKVSVEHTHADFKRNVAEAGISTGYRLNVNNWQIQPHIGTRYYHLGSTRYWLSNTRVNAPSADIVAPYAGINLAYNITLSNGVKLQLTFSSIYRDANRKADLDVNSYRLTQQFGRFWENELGLNAQFGNWNADVFVGYAKGNETGSRKSAGTTVKYVW
ncbi:S6 family peptidase [Kingella negevensis]|uniref:S6 family peptidase n=1 Tax=Kingella negevensis TaxID=1522312 RepID=UPI00254C213D|nr:S6 family peptidase [Kingella negevensis]MDK4685433.1 S6 family peptidase [Kingella negevensis]MDK4707297.1 S6 family peptidase [Kingella negevensis]MDK4710225.1 S6 family peptidase [Kingella negevensis]